jgi:hypothetical protein
VPARRARTVELQECLADAEPLLAQVQEPYAARDDVAPVLALLDADAQLILDIVQIFALDQGHLAHVSISRPEPRTLAVAVPLDAAPFDGLDLIDTLHRRAAFGGHKDALDNTVHARVAPSVRWTRPRD